MSSRLNLAQPSCNQPSFLETFLNDLTKFFTARELTLFLSTEPLLEIVFSEEATAPDGRVLVMASWPFAALHITSNRDIPVKPVKIIFFMINFF
jgi:hypothetical protein